MHQRFPLSTSSEFQLPLAPIRRRGKRKSRAGRRRMNNAGNERREKRKERRGRLLIRHSFPRFFLSHEPDKKIELENETILTQTTLRFKLLKKKKKKELSPFAGDGVEWGKTSISVVEGAVSLLATEPCRLLLVISKLGLKGERNGKKHLRASHTKR